MISYLYYSAEQVTLVHVKTSCRIWIPKEQFKNSEKTVVKCILWQMDDKGSCTVSHYKPLHSKNVI